MNENVLFEEGGSFRAGSILMDNETSLQVELPGGKRSKIKASQILLRFQNPAPGQILKEAEPLAADIDVAFLWEIAGEGEFAFLDLAKDYYGHAPAAPEAASLLLALHAAPVYFQRKGKGHFRKAPADTLRAALAGIEKKRQQALAIEGWVEALIAGKLPAELAPHAASLLVKPDRNRPEIKAFEAAAHALSCSPPELLLRTGALKSPHDVHLQRFLAEQFPQGTGFPPFDLPTLPDDLPNADVRAFSIDDANTTEVDDAFSLTALPDGGWRIGIHIAAPGLALAHGDTLAAIARARLSTVYMPGKKITMLPEAVVDACTLAEGRACPAVSLYLQVDAAQNIVAHASCVERVHIAANLRHHEIEPWFNETSVRGALPEDKPFCKELSFLWRFACAAEARRGKPAATQGINDYSFEITGDLLDAENCRVQIIARKRGSPLDKLVAELMIIANTTWGGLLAERRIAALYRAQTGGKARMTTAPQPHEGLGVPQYAWMTSPLRRYCDLANQWQLIAALEGTPPPFAPRSAELFAALRDFELTYAAYAEFQRRMERYWCLRYLAQESMTTAVVVVRRDDLARFEDLPLFVRLPGTPRFPSGQRLKVAVDHLDFLALEAHCHVVEALDVQALVEEDDDEALPPEEMAAKEPETPVAPSAPSDVPVAAESAPV
ncbi:MAG: RNB domain-containing ribonuclease [Zoogloeaceae bacterium]|jgi:exoribonuclease-2|nr:RNB domain-containing ribonuclease [Zoogloeaceae bacterium]